MGFIKKYRDAFNREVWHRDVHAQSRSRQILIYWIRVAHVVIQDVTSGELSLRATSLVYTSILSLVPFLAFAFAVLKGFGVQNKIEPLLLDMFAPLGPKGAEITGKIIDFVNNVRAGVLGTLGLVILLYTIMSLARQVETAFNHVWRVREPRGLAEGFGHYLSVIMIGPLLLVAAFGITATVSSHTVVQHIVDWAPIGELVVVFAKILPYILVIGSFTFIYIFVPNTYVQFRPALVGAVLAGVLWELSGEIFAVLSVGSTRLTAIYSGFAILMMLMLWLYVSWYIVLVGSLVGFYVQNPELVRHGLRSPKMGGRTLERVALHIMYLIGRAYHEGHTPWSREQLARRLHLPTDVILEVLERLRERKLVTMVAGRIRRYVPGSDMNGITLRHIVNSVRYNPVRGDEPDRHIKPIIQAETVMIALDGAIDQALGNKTLSQFIEEGEPAELSTKTVLRARQHEVK